MSDPQTPLGAPKPHWVTPKPHWTATGWVGVGLRDGAPPDAPLRGCAHALLLEELLGADLPPMAPMGAALRPLQQRLRRCREYGVVMG